ncbi:MAG: 3'(2'),5'-bisphosphate nucleotidase CysQ [Myxococcales bacterium]|nr:3'(2'),5'-bisphosphate nucleotidase CysQ [Myxococcales bacterium]
MLADSLEVALRLAREASKEVMRVYESNDFGVVIKADGSPITAADKEANRIIVRGLRRYFPNDVVLSEESHFDRKTPLGRRVWMVDPIDGTQDFVQRTGDFAVMIGLCISGRPSLGVVAAPALGRTWAGGLGLGAFEETEGGRIPLSIWEPAPDEPIRFVVSRTHRPPGLDAVLAAVGPHTIVSRGGVGVKVGLVMSGEADAYLHPSPGTHLWDCCAPQAIIAAAGGRLTDASGQEIVYEPTQTANPRGVLAAPPELHARLAALVPAGRPIR